MSDLRKQLAGRGSVMVSTDSDAVSHGTVAPEHRTQRFFGMTRRGVAFRVIGTVVMGVFALTSLVSCGIISSMNAEEVKAESNDVNEVKREADTNEARADELPSETSAQRRVDAAAETAKQLAGFENVYLQETGALSYAGVPTMSSRDTQTKLTQAERTAIAKQKRHDRIDEAHRSIKGLVERVEMTENSVPLLPWSDLVTVLPRGKDVDISGFQWRSYSSPIFSKNGSVSVGFDLVDTKKPQVVLARVTGEYNAQTRVIENIVITEKEQDHG